MCVEKGRQTAVMLCHQTVVLKKRRYSMQNKQWEDYKAEAAEVWRVTQGRFGGSPCYMEATFSNGSQVFICYYFTVADIPEKICRPFPFMGFRTLFLVKVEKRSRVTAPPVNKVTVQKLHI